MAATLELSCTTDQFLEFEHPAPAPKHKVSGTEIWCWACPVDGELRSSHQHGNAHLLCQLKLPSVYCVHGSTLRRPKTQCADYECAGPVPMPKELPHRKCQKRNLVLGISGPLRWPRNHQHPASTPKPEVPGQKPVARHLLHMVSSGTIPLSWISTLS